MSGVHVPGQMGWISSIARFFEWLRTFNTKFQSLDPETIDEWQHNNLELAQIEEGRYREIELANAMKEWEANYVKPTDTYWKDYTGSIETFTGILKTTADLVELARLAKEKQENMTKEEEERLKREEEERKRKEDEEKKRKEDEDKRRQDEENKRLEDEKEAEERAKEREEENKKQDKNDTKHDEDLIKATFKRTCRFEIPIADTKYW